MSTHLSRHFEKARLALGLKPGQLAQAAGWFNFSKGANRIRKFEISGDISREPFWKINAVLKIDQATIEALIEQDRREFFEQWLKWVNEAIKPYLGIRWMAAVYGRIQLPPEITTMEEPSIGRVWSRARSIRNAGWSGRAASPFISRKTARARAVARARRASRMCLG